MDVSYLKTLLLSDPSGGSSTIYFKSCWICTFPLRLQFPSSTKMCKTNRKYEQNHETKIIHMLKGLKGLQIYQTCIQRFALLNKVIFIQKLFECETIFIKQWLHLIVQKPKLTCIITVWDTHIYIVRLSIKLQNQYKWKYM